MTARVLHTADVHLHGERPARRDALEAVLSLAAERDVDVVTIGGDLFDRPDDVESLRADLRNDLFADRPFEILLIPGNHDEAAFRDDVFFGDACTVLAEAPFEHWTSADGALRITGLPYREAPDDDLLLALRDREAFGGTEALLLHGSLDAPFADETGDEGAGRYFPVSRDLLAELGFDYYLAGHYHGAHQVSLPDGATFTYPGTPASTTTAETGRRRVSLLDPAGGVDFEPLETFHYAVCEETVSPGEEDALLETVANWADRHAVPQAEASVTVEGFVAMDEATFHDRLVDAAAPASVTDDARSVDRILSRPLYQSFLDELAERDWDEETTAAVRQRTLAVYSRLAANQTL
jgi:DNA repair exonuclease SbcCD nuclease subunit